MGWMQGMRKRTPKTLAFQSHENRVDLVERLFVSPIQYAGLPKPQFSTVKAIDWIVWIVKLISDPVCRAAQTPVFHIQNAHLDRLDR